MVANPVVVGGSGGLLLSLEDTIEMMTSHTMTNRTNIPIMSLQRVESRAVGFGSTSSLSLLASASFLFQTTRPAVSFSALLSIIFDLKANTSMSRSASASG
jgi:hypothetical protein